MTMTSGVGTPFFMAPEMATGTKHYTGAVDVFSFGIMAAQVMVGHLVYDSSDSFETKFGLLFSISLFHSQTNHTVLFFCLSLASCCYPKQNTQCYQAGKNTSALRHMQLFLTHEGWMDGLTLTTVDDHPMTLTSTPPINQTHPLSLSFNPSLNTP